jgi:hypothetical protein
MSSPHKLSWSLGSQGGGVLSLDGRLETWCGDRKVANGSSTSFSISTDGFISNVSPRDNIGDILSSIDPRLSDYQGQERSLNGGGEPLIVGDYPDPSEGQIMSDRNGYFGRRPFIYHQPTNTAHIGAPGEYHDDVYRRTYGLDPRKDAYEGFIMKGMKKHPYQEHPDMASWFNDAPDNHEEVLNTIAKQHSVPPVHFRPLTQQDNLWDFTASVDDDTVNMLAGPGPQRTVKPKDESVFDRNRREWEEEKAREREEYIKDPIGSEKKLWDGDESFGSNVEWVPTEHLKKFMEYDRRPGGKDFKGNPERWNALSDHIKQNGLKNPVVLEYNPDTGHAHMGEGNHRTQIAIDHGIQELPVQVVRGRRDSPTQIPVDLQPQDSWMNHRDEMHIPSIMRPSHIGLPTVPRPGQKVASTPTPWSPGHLGKGLLYYDSQGGTKLVTWAVNTVMNPNDEGMHHEDMIERLKPQDIYCHIVSINEDGQYTIFNADNNPRYDVMIQKLDPRLSPDTKAEWSFG